jgi:hypothetical protein
MRELCRELFDDALVDYCVQLLLNIKGFTKMFTIFLFSKCSKSKDFISCLVEQSDGFRKFVNIILDEIKKTIDEVIKSESTS